MTSWHALRGAIYGGFALTGVVTTLLGPILPLLSARWGLSDNQAGYLFAAQFVGATVGVLLSGPLALRVGSIRSIAAGFGLIAAGVGTLAAAGWPWGLMGVFGYGLGLGVAIPTTNLLVSEANPPRAAAALSILNMVWGAGAVVCPLAAAAVIRVGGLHLMLAGLAVVFVGLALPLASARPAPPAAPVDQPPSLTCSLWSHPSLPLVGALFFLYVGTENTLSGWAASYARRLSVQPGTPWVLAPAFFWAALLLGRALAPAILRRIPEVGLACGGLVVTALGVTVLLAARNLAGVFAGVSAAGLGLAPVFPITIAMLSHRFGSLASRVAGGMFALAGLGGATLPWLVGFLSNQVKSLRIGLGVPLVTSLTMLILHWRVGRGCRCPEK
jgi:fucose permease